MIRRCVYCRRRIWPWQSQGWLVLDAQPIHWHGRCFKEAGR